MQSVIPKEFDFEREARLCATLRARLHAFRQLAVPEPLLPLCGPGIIVMERMRGEVQGVLLTGSPTVHRPVSHHAGRLEKRGREQRHGLCEHGRCHACVMLVAVALRRLPAGVPLTALLSQAREGDAAARDKCRRCLEPVLDAMGWMFMVR